MSILAWIILGLIAGFIGSKIVNHTGEGIFLDIILGIVGAVIGGWLFSAFGASGVTGLNIYSLIVAVIGAVVFLMVKLGRRGSRPNSPAEMNPQLPAAQGTDETFSKKLENQLAEHAALRQKQEADALSLLKLPPVTKKAEVLTKHIGEQAKKDSTAMAHVLRSWMGDAKS